MSSDADAPAGARPFGLSADEAARGYEEAFGGHGEHGRDIPPNRRRIGETDNRRAPTFDDDPERRARLEAATAMDRETYTVAGYQDLRCTYCDTSVKVRKNSEKHTSVQWSAEAAAACPLREEWARERDRSCPRLRKTIQHAFAEGIISLAPDVDPVDSDHMVNPVLDRDRVGPSPRKDH